MNMARALDNRYLPDAPAPWRTWTLGAVLVAILCALAGAAVGWASMQGLQLAGLYPQARWADVTIAIVLSFGSTIALLGAWVRIFEHKGMTDAGFGANAARGMVRGAASGALFLLVVLGGLGLSGACGVVQGGSITQPSFADLAAALLLALAFLVQASCEEFIFRGWALPVIASRHGRILGVVGSTVLFTLGHASNIRPSPELFLGLVNVFLSGLFLALYAVRGRSLWGPCGWHAAWNWLLSVGFGLNVSGLEVGTAPVFLGLKLNAGEAWWLSGGSFGPEASAMTSLVLLAGIAYWIRFDRPRPPA